MATQERVLLEAVSRPRRSSGLRGGISSLIRRKPLGAVAALVIVLLGIVAAGAPVITSYGPETMDRRQAFRPPSQEYLMGTDRFGRSVYDRVVYGAQVSLTVGFTAVVLGTLLGASFGIATGYLGRKFDLIVQRVMDVLMAFPTIILALILVAVLGPSLLNVALVLAIVIAPGANRVIRGATLSLKEEQFIAAARAIGCTSLDVMARHILPNVLPAIIVLASIAVGRAILTEASLSFLGLGPPPPTPTWGAMLSVEGRAHFERAPWLAIFPGLAISLTVLAFNLFGDALRDLWDPRLRDGRG